MVRAATASLCRRRPTPPGLWAGTPRRPGGGPDHGDTLTLCEDVFCGECKHGPLSAVHGGYPVALITAPGDEMMIINHVNEVTVRGERAIAIAAEHQALGSNVHDYPVVPGLRTATCSRARPRGRRLNRYWVPVAPGESASART
jgi:hypothetical protein